MNAVSPPMTNTFTDGDRCEEFLAQVARYGRIESAYDARDVVEVVFRTMRDVMSLELREKITHTLTALNSLPVEGIATQPTLAELWCDTNPLVRWISRVRGPLVIEDETFLRRVQQEGGVPKGTDAYAVTEATFGALKAELTSELASEISQCLPGEVRSMWRRA